MKSFMVFAILICLNNAIAGSHIEGAWVDGGNTLSIHIVDNSEPGKAIAAEIWNSMLTPEGDNSGYRFAKSSTFHLMCNTQSSSTGALLGTCSFLVSAARIYDHDRNLSFAIIGDEGVQSLTGFVPGVEAHQIRSDKLDQYGLESFIFEANMANAFVVAVLSKDLLRQ